MPLYLYLGPWPIIRTFISHAAGVQNFDLIAHWCTWIKNCLSASKIPVVSSSACCGNATGCGHGGLMQWLKLPAWKFGDSWFEPRSGIQVSNKQIVSSPLNRKDFILWGASVTEVAFSVSDRHGSNFILWGASVTEVAFSVSDRHGSNFEFCVWRATSSHSSHHP